MSIALMAIPGAPVFDDETAAQFETLMAKGAAGTIFLTTEDCRAGYEELKGIDSSFAARRANHIRLAQLSEVAAA